MSDRKIILLYDPIKDILWEYRYWGWVEGYMATSTYGYTVRALEIPLHFEHIGEL